MNEAYTKNEISNLKSIILMLKDIKSDVDMEWNDYAMDKLDVLIKQITNKKNALENKVSDKDTKELEVGFIKASLDFALDSGDKELFNKLSEKYCELVR